MLHIFTFATDLSKARYLKQTEEFHNIHINYIGASKWTGYLDKITYMKTAIATLPPDDIVCFVDAYDVLVNEDESEIIRRFKSYDCDLLFGVELNCYPDTYKSDLDSVNTIEGNLYKYINTGGYIGYTKAVKDMFEWKNDAELKAICDRGTDQAYGIEYFLSNVNTKQLKLDIECKLFQNMHLVSWNELEFRNGHMYNIVMEVSPCFIHFNGGTFQTNTRENIMPVFIQKKVETKLTTKRESLDNYKQIITKTCYPHPQRLPTK
jgi:hypothetical protein